MKPRTQIILFAALLAGLAALSSLRRGAESDSTARSSGACCPLMAALDAKPLASAKDSTTNEPTTTATSPQVIAYYFHGTVRCETCLLIENYAKAAIEQQFGEELVAKRLVFLPVNYDLPENAHFLKDYKLPCPSLVLVRQTNGKDEKWKLLSDTWQLVHEPAKLNRYVETEVRTFLRGREQQTHTNKVELPPAPDAR
jgi:hypothetical protein